MNPSIRGIANTAEDNLTRSGMKPRRGNGRWRVRPKGNVVSPVVISLYAGMHALIVDFDADDWIPHLDRALADLIPPETRVRLQRSRFRYVEDALDVLVPPEMVDGFVDATLDWIRAATLRVFHGTRLTDSEAAAMAREGLRLLDIQERVRWLRSTFPAIAMSLSDDEVRKALNAGQLKYRENQIHAAISRSMMLSGYDYLSEGSEFDRRLLQHADRPDLISALKERGTPRLVSLLIPGAEALDAMHPFFDIDHVRSVDRYPNLVRQLLVAFAWSLHSPGDTRAQTDACLLFRQALPGSYVERIEAFRDMT